MEKEKENKEEILTVIDKQKKDKEDFKKHLEEFILFWEREAEELKNREIDEDNSRYIFLNFEKSKLDLNGCGYYSDLFELSDYSKLELTESKLHNSLAIARSNFHSKHRTVLERLVDSIGGIFHFFGKGN